MANEITREYIQDVFEYKEGFLILKKKRNHGAKVGEKVGTLQNTGYLAVNLFRVPRLVHRLIFLMHHGFVPEFIDHIDGDRTNNKIENLRPATRTQNNQNSKIKKNNKLGIKGVHLHKETGKYRARICVNRKIINLGLFSDSRDAAIAYAAAAVKLHGKFANTGVSQ